MSLQSAKFVKKRRKRLIGSFLILCLFAFVVTAFFVFILRLESIQISKVDVLGAVSISAEKIKDKAMLEIKGKYFKVIPESNIIFYPEGSITSGLLEEFKEIDTVDIRRSGLSQITLNIKERVPVAIVCEGFHEEGIENDNCYFSDDKGYVFRKIEKPYPDNYNRYYIPSDGGNINTGSLFIDKERFNALQEFVNGASREGLEPLGILIGDKGEYEMYVNRNTTVYFDDRSPFDETLLNLIVFWRDALQKEKARNGASSTPSFDYINLRFGNAIYYSKP